MIGRAAIGYPWIFDEIKHYFSTGSHLPPPAIEQRVDVIRKHLYASVSWKGNVAGLNEMKRHYANYLKGLPNIKEFRNRLVILKTVEEINEVLDQVTETYSGFEFERRSIDMGSMAYSCE